jgi:hypothetical protein
MTMPAALLVADLQARGVTLEPRGDRLAVRPVDRVTSGELEALKRHKPEVLALLRRADSEVARVLGLRLPQLDRLLEVRVPWLAVSLWFVPDPSAAEVLVGEGVSRGRIWTSSELIDLIGIPNITTASARRLAETKAAIDGEITAVRCPRDKNSPTTVHPQPGCCPA